jgi:hypothetical protein
MQSADNKKGISSVQNKPNMGAEKITDHWTLKNLIGLIKADWTCKEK